MKKISLWALIFLTLVCVFSIDLHAEENVYSTNFVMIESQSGEVLYEQGKDEVIYPASMTKIMTLLIAIENIDDYDTFVTLDASIFTGLQEANASVAGFRINERVTIRDLLYGILLPSGADACVAIANYVAGDEDAYVELMNAKAVELGMEQTTFLNTTGLHLPGHVSSVNDIAKLLQFALKNPVFKAIFESKSYTTTPSNVHPNGIYLTSTTFNASDTSMSYLLGGKTGFTFEAGLCLASAASQEGMDLVLVTAHAPAEMGYVLPLHLIDAKTLYDRAYAEYHRVKAIEMNEELQQLPVGKKLEKTTISVRANQEVSLLMRKDQGKEDLIYEFQWESLEAPINEGDLIQKVTVKFDDEVIAEMKIFASENIQADYRYKLLTPQYSLWTSLVALCLILMIRHLRFTRSKR